MRQLNKSLLETEAEINCKAMILKKAVGKTATVSSFFKK